MTRIIGIGLALLLLAVLTVGAAGAAPKDKPSTVAIAIGQVVEDDGMRNTFDLRAQSDGQRTGGTLRFFCPHKGYYNGAVRTLAVENGTIKATGGGGLIQPDGKRVRVTYTATIRPDKRVEMVVTGKNVDYSMVGSLQPGFVKAGDPRALLDAAPSGASDHSH